MPLMSVRLTQISHACILPLQLMPFEPLASHQVADLTALVSVAVSRVV